MEQLNLVETDSLKATSDSQVPLNYFYGAQSELFTFYRIPKALFTNGRFKELSTEAKLLYGILLDRMSLSAKNNWSDEHGRIYIIYKVEEAQEALRCKNQKVAKLFSELEKDFGLIERKWQGFGLPPIIFVKNFIEPVPSSAESESPPCDFHTPGSVKITPRIGETSHDEKCENHTTGSVKITPRIDETSHDKKCENHTTGNVKITSQEIRKSHANNTDPNDTDFSDTNSLIDRLIGGVQKKIEFSILELSYSAPEEQEALHILVRAVAEALASKNPRIKVNGQILLPDYVKNALLNINSTTVYNVMERYLAQSDKVANPKSYLLTSIFNELTKPTLMAETDED